ncbi:MAG: primosome assembly protein PriA, partial [Kiritimatiellae bacterium]|nr:primosome assembly protein PriA [Kiritimatiellia bacterium]
MAVTETTKVGWGSRLGTSIKGVLFGLILFVIGFPVLFTNEGNYVKMAKALDEGEGACIAVESPDEIDPEMNGKLVHMTGRANTKDVLSDDAFGVSATAIRLSRKVEMYQWREHRKTEEKKKLGGSVEKTTTYTYDKDWSEEVISSSDFKEPGHDNPAAMEFASEDR